MDNNNTNLQVSNQILSAPSKGDQQPQSIPISTNQAKPSQSSYDNIVSGQQQQFHAPNNLNSQHPAQLQQQGLLLNNQVHLNAQQQQQQHQNAQPNETMLSAQEKTIPNLPSTTAMINTPPIGTQQHYVGTPQSIRPLLENDTSSNIDKSSNTIQMPDLQQQQQAPGLSPQKSTITKVKLSDELNIFDWLRTTDIIHQIAEKAKSSVDSVITTLDPGMKEYLYSGGNVNIMVISDSSCLISPIRDSFQTVFGRATVIQAKYCPPNATNIDYPIKLASGFEQIVLVAKEKIKKLRMDSNNVPQNQVVAIVQPGVISVECPVAGNSSHEILPRWFLTYCMLLEDPVLNLTINCYSQYIPLDEEIVAKATQESIYPGDFNDRKHLGYTMSIDQLMSSRLQIEATESEGLYNDEGCAWLPRWSGNKETQLIHQLSLALANAYRRRWNDCVQIETGS